RKDAPRAPCRGPSSRAALHGTLRRAGGRRSLRSAPRHADRPMSRPLRTVLRAAFIMSPGPHDGTGGAARRARGARVAVVVERLGRSGDDSMKSMIGRAGGIVLPVAMVLAVVAAGHPALAANSAVKVTVRDSAGALLPGVDVVLTALGE